MNLFNCQKSSSSYLLVTLGVVLEFNFKTLTRKEELDRLFLGSVFGFYLKKQKYTCMLLFFFCHSAHYSGALAPLTTKLLNIKTGFLDMLVITKPE